MLYAPLLSEELPERRARELRVGLGGQCRPLHVVDEAGHGNEEITMNAKEFGPETQSSRSARLPRVDRTLNGPRGARLPGPCPATALRSLGPLYNTRYPTLGRREERLRFAKVARRCPSLAFRAS